MMPAKGIAESIQWSGGNYINMEVKYECRFKHRLGRFR